MPVTAADYPDRFVHPGAQGFGMDIQAMADAMAMAKSLSAGSGTESSSFAGGRAMIPESLENVLQTTLWGERHIKLFKQLPSSPLNAVVDEYTIRDSYGGRWGTATAESSNPAIRTSSIQREVEQCAFYRDRREVTHVAMQVDMIDPGAEAEEEEAATRVLLRAIEEDLFVGNQDVYATRMKGLRPRIFEQGGDLVVDANGTAVTTMDEIHKLSAVVEYEGGALSHAFFDTIVGADITSAAQDSQRFQLTPQAGGGELTAGTPITELVTDYGTITLERDRFVQARYTMHAPDTPAGPDTDAIPGTPTVNSVAGNAGTISNQTNLPAGDYYVRVSAVCENGESAACTAESVTLTAGNTIQISVTPADAKATGYRVYLSEVDASDGSDCRLHEETEASGGTETLELDGTWVTGTTEIYLLSMEEGERAIDWRQLFPMTRMDLAVTSPAYPFLVQIYGYLRLMKPNWHGVIRNVLPSNVDWNPLGA